MQDLKLTAVRSATGAELRGAMTTTGTGGVCELACASSRATQRQTQVAGLMRGVKGGKKKERMFWMER